MKTTKAYTHIPLCMLGVFLVITSGACVAEYFIPTQWLCCWRGEVAMAFNTALCFVAVGVAFIIISRWRKQTQEVAAGLIEHAIMNLKNENKAKEGAD